MRKTLTALLILLCALAVSAKRRDGWELDLGGVSSLTNLVDGNLEAGPRVDFGFYDHQFYAGASLSWLYNNQREAGDVLAAVRAGWRFESARRPAFFSVFAEAQYWGGPWGTMKTSEAPLETGIISLNFHPAVNLRFTDWLAFGIEMPIAFPITGDKPDIDVQARVFLYTYF
ncbi:MAG: hypothetical protein GF403_06165 [Candidatus Coatesbacteria bacterium]|nr:hypothetical protein [Candidatus Coatesbacteria bacterium]